VRGKYLAGASTAPGSSGATNMPLKLPAGRLRHAQSSRGRIFDGISEGLLSDRIDPSVG
jgi:hypothetical protein